MIVTLFVMNRFKQFWYGMKATNSGIIVKQQTLKKIEMMEFYMQIEWTYVLMQVKNILNILSLFIYFGNKEAVQKKEKINENNQQSIEYLRVVLVVIFLACVLLCLFVRCLLAQAIVLHPCTSNIFVVTVLFRCFGSVSAVVQQ